MASLCRVIGVLAAVGLAVGLSAAPVSAQSKVKGKGSGQIRVSDTDRAGSQDLGVIDIEGRIYKPSVFYVLARSDNIATGGIEFRQTFLDRIVKGARNRPF